MISVFNNNNNNTHTRQGCSERSNIILAEPTIRSHSYLRSISEVTLVVVPEWSRRLLMVVRAIIVR